MSVGSWNGSVFPSWRRLLVCTGQSGVVPYPTPRECHWRNPDAVCGSVVSHPRQGPAFGDTLR